MFEAYLRCHRRAKKLRRNGGEQHNDCKYRTQGAPNQTIAALFRVLYPWEFYSRQAYE